MKSIILEGPNGSGKSSLGQLLSVILQIPYIHAGPSPGEGWGEACAKQLNDLREGCILDRCTPISEVVYNEIDCDDKVQSLGEWLEDMMKEAVLVYCTAWGGITDKEHYTLEHLQFITQNQDGIRARYDNLMEEIPHLEFCWTIDDVHDLVKQIEEKRNAVV